MEKPTILHDLILHEGETVIINGIAINDKMADHLMELLTEDYPSKSIESISSDLLYNKMHHIEHLEKDGEVYGSLSESTTLLNMTLIGLLTEMGLLDDSLYAGRKGRNNAYLDSFHVNSNPPSRALK